MEKNDIIAHAKEYLLKDYSDQHISELASSAKKFFSSIQNMDYSQVKKVLEKNPSLSNKYYDGWHSINYACLTNDPGIVNQVVTIAVNEQKLEFFPQTNKFKKGIPENTTLLHFCAANNLDKAYAKLISFMGNLEEINFSTHIRYAFAYNSLKTGLFIKHIIEDKYQEEMLNFYAGNNKAYQIFVENFKYNPEKFDDWGIDVKTTKDGLNYFSLTMKMIEAYYYDVEEKVSPEKFERIVNYFLDRGFTLETKDLYDETIRTNIEKIINRFSSFSFSEKIKNLNPKFEKKSLENQLNKENNFKKTKLKI